MYLVKRERNDFPSLLSRFLNEPFGFDRWLSRPWEEDSVMWAPRVDVKETEDSYQFLADLPGLKKNEIKVSMTDNVLTLSGERKHEKEEKKEGRHFSERSYGQFCRSFQLPEKVKAEEIKANYKNGVLEITLPKADEVKPREIEIR